MFIPSSQRPRSTTQRWPTRPTRPARPARRVEWAGGLPGASRSRDRPPRELGLPPRALDLPRRELPPELRAPNERVACGKMCGTTPAVACQLPCDGGALQVHMPFSTHPVGLEAGLASALPPPHGRSYPMLAQPILGHPFLYISTEPPCGLGLAPMRPLKHMLRGMLHLSTRFGAAARRYPLTCGTGGRTARRHASWHCDLPNFLPPALPACGWLGGGGVRLAPRQTALLSARQGQLVQR